MDEVDSGVFEQFMSWFAEPGVADRNNNVADMLAAQFGDMGWAANQSSADTYRDIMSRRLADTVDGQSLLAEFTGRLSPDGGDVAAAELVDWLADQMTANGWAEHTVPEQDGASGAWYRYDLVYGVYQWEDPRTPGAWLSQEEYSALQVGGRTEDGERYSPAVFDDHSYLWYRYDHGFKTYEWAESDPATEPDPAGAWMSEADAAQQRQFTAPQMDTRTGTRYRFDRVERVYQWEDPAARHSWLTEAEFTARTARPGSTETGQYSEAVFDGNYGMWYRYHSGARTYSWHTGDADTPPGEDGWMSQSAADQLRRATAQPSEPVVTAGPEGTTEAGGLPATGDTEPATEPPPLTPEAAESIQKIRELVVQPSVDEVMSKLPDEFKERIGEAELQNLVRSLVVQETAKIAAA